MLKPRLIPFLLIHDDGLIKTINFSNPKYVGDPINAVRIFNEKQVDEIIICDKKPSLMDLPPNFDLIKKLAVECRMPFCYAGGIKELSQAEKIIGMGVEKIGLNTALFEDKQLLTTCVSSLGSQSVVAIIDVKKNLFGTYKIFSNGGLKKQNISLPEWIERVQELGVGEIVLNNISRDGMMNGYDIDLIDLVQKRLSIPLTVLGGAGSDEHFKDLYSRYGIIGASAGSYFVFKGKYRAVLINYPDENRKNFFMNQ
jgi:cyclase